MMFVPAEKHTALPVHRHLQPKSMGMSEKSSIFVASNYRLKHLLNENKTFIICPRYRFGHIRTAKAGDFTERRMAFLARQGAVEKGEHTARLGHQRAVRQEMGPANRGYRAERGKDGYGEIGALRGIAVDWERAL